MEKTEFTECMGDFLKDTSKTLAELKSSIDEYIKNPVTKEDKTQYKADLPGKRVLTEDQIESKIIELAEKARKIPSTSFTDKVKKECFLDKELADKAIEKLIENGSISKKE